MPIERSPTRWLLGWLAVALIARLLAAVAVDRVVSATPGRLCLIEGDADGYWQLGKKLAAGDEYALYEPPRRILRMPGFPVLLAACQRVFGDDTFPVRCVLAVIGTLGCWGAYLLGRDLVDAQVGLWACAATSLSPPLVVFSPLLLTEMTFSTLLVFSIWMLVRLCQTQEPGQTHKSARTRLLSAARWQLAAVAGLWMAAATYVRPTWLPIAGVGAVAIVAFGRFRWPRLAEAALLLFVCCVALLPWTWRNYRVSGHAIPTTLWVGPSLYDGLNPGATGDSDMTFFDQENLISRMSEYEMDQEYRRRAWAFVAANPGRTLELAVIKAGRYWSPWPNGQQFQQPLPQFGLLLTTLPLYAGMLAGIWLKRRDPLFLLATLGPVIFFCLVHMLFVGSIRYRLPAEPTMWVAAATGGVFFWQRLTGSPPSRSSTEGAGA